VKRFDQLPIWQRRSAVRGLGIPNRQARVRNVKNADISLSALLVSTAKL